MNAEKTTLGIQTCSVSVSERDASEHLCDAAFKLTTVASPSQLVTATWRGPSVRRVIGKPASASVGLE